MGESGSGKPTLERAILKDAPIVILDEATSSVDPDNESYIKGAVHFVLNITLLKTVKEINCII